MLTCRCHFFFNFPQADDDDEETLLNHLIVFTKLTYLKAAPLPSL